MSLICDVEVLSSCIQSWEGSILSHGRSQILTTPHLRIHIVLFFLIKLLFVVYFVYRSFQLALVLFFCIVIVRPMTVRVVRIGEMRQRPFRVLVSFSLGAIAPCR